MKRVQLFEFEDFDCFPDTFRSTMTKLIVVMHKIFGTREVLTNLSLTNKDQEIIIPRLNKTASLSEIR